MTTDATPEQKYAFLVDCLRLLAAPYRVQASIFQGAEVAEEILVAHDDVLGLLADQDVVRLCKPAALSWVFALTRAVSLLHGDVRNFSEVGLNGSAQWQAVRGCAAEALFAQDEGWRPPEFQGGATIQGGSA